jgi:hypothetical protein
MMKIKLIAPQMALKTIWCKVQYSEGRVGKDVCRKRGKK